MTPDQAMPIIEKAMFVLPNDPRSYFYAGTVETDAGNTEKAIQHYEKTIEIIKADASYLQVELPLGISMKFTSNSANFTTNRAMWTQR